jgi:hypothetical protein
MKTTTKSYSNLSPKPNFTQQYHKLKVGTTQMLNTKRTNLQQNLHTPRKKNKSSTKRRKETPFRCMTSV